MKQKFTIQTTALFTMLVAVCFLANTINAQTVIFEEQFDGGIDSTWTNNPLSSGDPNLVQNSLWEWSANGSADAGAYWNDSRIIQSPSVANGCALFNSDFLDNAGVPGDFGLGLSPSPHAGELISPIIDCSAYPNVSLQFYQSYRNFDSATRVEISADSGATWIPLIINDELSGNEATDPDDIQLHDISNIVGGSNGCQLKFVFDGDYYFWLIDDVKLITTPANLLNLTQAAYPVLFGTPSTQLPSITELDAEICNNGSAEQPNTSLNCVITDSDGAEIFNSTGFRIDDGPFPVDNIAGEDSCEVLIIPETFDMASLALEADVYTVNYTASSDSMNYVDIVTATQPFTVTTNVLRKAPFVSNGGLTVGGGGPFEFGYQFFIPNDGDKITSADFMMSAQDDMMGGEAATVKIYAIGPEPLADAATPDDLSLKGFGTFEFPDTYVDNDLATVELIDLIEGDPGIILDAGTYYLAMVAYTGPNVVFMTINNQVDFGFTNAIHDVIIDGDGTLFTGGFEGTSIPTLDLHLEQILDPNSSEEVVNSFNINLYPNPADQLVQLELDLEEVSDHLSIRVTDAFGKIIEDRNYQNVQKENIIFDTNQYPTGSYLIFLRSENKVQSHKFVIIH